MKSKSFSLLLVFISVIVLYYPVFFVYFSQDDFFGFQVSKTDGSIADFVNLFGFHPFIERGIAFYRPIFREGLFNIFYSIFGLNHLPFRILSFLIHFVNVVLVCLLLQKLFKKVEVSLFAAFFFGIVSANVAVLYYLAGGIQALGATMFILLSVISFLKYLEGDGLKFKFFSFAAFILGLGSHELAAVIPVLLAGIIFIKVPIKRLIANILIELWPFLVLLSVYVYLDIVKIGFQQQDEQYRVVFSLPKIINSFAWYSAWALGVPEMLIDFVRPGLKLNPSLMRYWGEYFRIIFVTFFASLLFIVGSLGYLFLRKREFFRNKKFWLLVLWFPFSILPVVFLPLHKSTYYLAPALPAFWGVLGVLFFSAYRDLKRKHPKLSFILFGAVTTSLFVLSATSVKLGDSTYPAATRGRIAERLIREVLLKYPTVPLGSAVYFANDPSYPFVAKDWGGTSKQAAFVLNNEDALQFLYKDPTLRVFYEDLDGVPPDFPKDKVYSLVARLQ